MKNLKKVLLSVASVSLAMSLLSGCSSDGSSMYGSASGSDDSYARSTSIDGVPTFVGQDGKLTSGQAAVQDEFYFAFDRSDLTAEGKAELRKHARYLLKNPNAKVRVEGHTDERGSREYNVALGERRAKSVAKELLNEGVVRDQVAVVSYGEEKPSVKGHNESAWKWNRRAKVAYELG